MLNRIVDWLIARAKRTPYFHLHHADGSLYMERYWLFRTRWCSAKIHGIHTPDLDRAMHDHPWSFISLVLRGAYIETRPLDPYMPDFFSIGDFGDFGERCTEHYRGAGSVAFRRYSDRHRITLVATWEEIPVWTLFITFPKRQAWGFYTPEGKTWWWVYESVHNKFNMEHTLNNKDAN